MKWFKYENFNEEFRWNAYNDKLIKYGVIGLLEEILNDIDIRKGFAVVDSFTYLENINLYYRTLCKLDNYIIYNEYFQKIIDKDEANREIEKQREELRISKINSNNTKQKSIKRSKKPRVKVSVVRDIFDNSNLYIIDDLDSGISKTSRRNPIIEEKDYKDLKGIKFNFNKIKIK